MTERKPVRVAHPDLGEATVSANAVTVVETLRDAGYEAYLVGGCVRDLLLGGTPKDFDVATDATPQEVKTVFPRARLIGRRFRIAHVRFRREFIEVSTFRRRNEDDDDESDANHVSADGVLLSDNVYGTLDEDAFRRDFTVNALYYDPVEDAVLDYTTGLDDIETRTLRIIGEPRERLREDPVRILRAMRFAAKLGFTLDPETRDAIAPMSELLTAIPPARLFDEFNKLFMNGHAVAAWSLMWEFGLPEILFPLSEDDDRLVRAALQSTDGRVAEDKPVTPGFLLAAMCWPEFERRTALSATAKNAADERLKAAHSVIAEQQLTIAFPRRLSLFIRDVWRLQSTLERRPPRNLKRTLSHPRFRAAYDFLVLRAETGEADPELAQWWTDAQETPAEERGSMTNALRPGGRRRRRRRGRGRPNPEPAT
ncbi:MAG: polynucleotide adenylyltransferase PcnB [Gammaproteobacteria bacterium]|nr:polynucleotide adenylyltransferase PcnB [Gammaproteobacteria bacterium]